MPIDDRTPSETAQQQQIVNTQSDTQTAENLSEYKSDVDKTTPAVQMDKPEPIVLAMITKAEEHMNRGEIDQALASLERAARIKPKDPWLWHSMAVLQLQNSQWLEAVSLAEKSISLSSDYQPLLAANWEIIYQAKKALGDDKGVNEALKQWKRYRSNSVS